MKLLYLIDNYSLGGAQTIVKGIMENNVNNKNVLSIGLRHKAPELSIHNSNAITIKSKSKYSIAPLLFIRKFIMNNDIDIIHCQLPRSILTGYLLKRFYYPHLKFIIHEQGDIYESRLYAIILRLIYKGASGIIACSEATAKEMNRRSGIPFGQIKVIYNFVDLQRFSVNKQKSIQVKNIGFAGRIVKRKGWREFVHAAHELKQPDLKYFIAGTGSEVSKLKSLIKLLNLKNLDYKGFINQTEQFYSSIDLLIIPSHYEPMGMVAIEAMAGGILVAASDVPGLNEIVRHQENGWLFQPQSVESLIAAIKEVSQSGNEVLESIQRTALISAAAFSYDHFNEKIVEIYRTFN